MMMAVMKQVFEEQSVADGVFQKLVQSVDEEHWGNGKKPKNFEEMFETSPMALFGSRAEGRGGDGSPREESAAEQDPGSRDEPGVVEGGLQSYFEVRSEVLGEGIIAEQ